MITSVTPYGVYITVRLWVDPAAGMGGGGAAAVREAILRRFRESGVGMVWEIDMIRAGGKNGGGRGLTRGDDAVIFGPNAGGGDDDNETMMAAQQADTAGYM